MVGCRRACCEVQPAEIAFSLSTRASGEMADALASGASVRKDVGVQVPPRPHSSRNYAYAVYRLPRRPKELGVIFLLRFALGSPLFRRMRVGIRTLRMKVKGFLHFQSNADRFVIEFS
jgi:hypothetical protein